MKFLKNFKGISYNSPVVLTFALISLAALILANVTRDWTTLNLFCVWGGSWSWTDPLAYFRLFGHIFGHGNFDHYTGNFILILLVGPMLEERYGSGRMAGMIFITGLLTGIIFTLFFPRVLLLGASGIAFMLILLSSFTNARTGKIPLTLIFAVVIYIGREVLAGLNDVLGIAPDRVSQLGHVIGAVCGLIFGFLYSKVQEKRNY
jgi:membrane associated rhomboid family serine protease